MHRWIEHTAELELEIDAATEEGVFVEAAEALRALLGMRAHGGPALRQVEAAASDRPALLADWLNELVFLSEQGFVPERVVALELGDAGLRATVEGRTGEPRSLVKAVTYHRLRLEPEGVRWRGRVVLDV